MIACNNHNMHNPFPRRRSPITESTREVLFLFDWCFCAWLPPSLYLRYPRASLGDCEDRSRRRPLRRKWSGASPRPPSGTTPPYQILHGVMHVMIVACYHPLPLSSCMLNFDLVSILSGTSIPTSFNIFVKMFLHFI